MSRLERTPVMERANAVLHGFMCRSGHKSSPVSARITRRCWALAALVATGGALTLSSCGSSRGAAGHPVVTTTTVSSAERDQVAAADNDCAAAATTLDSLTKLPMASSGKLPSATSRILGVNFGLVEQSLGKLSRVPVTGQEGSRVRRIDTLLRQSTTMMQKAVADVRSDKTTTGVALERRARQELKSAERSAASASMGHCATAHGGNIAAK